MKPNRNLFVVTLAAVILATGFWFTGSIKADAKAWSSADLYQQEHKNHRPTAQWTFKAFH